jgi:putative N-acetyltransferase (TIGR04045 family)
VVLRTAVECHAAGTSEELAAHYAVRHAVFVREQHVFDADERDARDDDPATIHVVGFVTGVAGGTVRLYPLDGSRWLGDRLAVLPRFRAHGLGAPLVRYAVRTAAAHGGTVMLAHVQLPNVEFFTHLGWRRDGPEELYAGLPHQPMTIDL